VGGSRARDAREYSKWALGPGLIGLAQDDDERRRAVLALFSRGGDVPGSSSPAAALGAAASPGLVDRLRTAVTARVASVPGMDNVMQFVQQDPDAARRIVAVVAGGVALAATIMLGLLSDQPGGPNHAEAEERPVAIGTTTTTPPPEPPAPAAPVVSTSTSATTSTVPARQNPPATPAAATTTKTTTPVPTTTTTAKQPVVPAEPSSEAETPADPEPRDIDIDATGASYVSFGISGEGGWKDARRVQPFRLSLGTHVLLTSPGYRIVFTVTDSWTVDYDHRYDHVVAGRGTQTLAVHGLPVTVDTTGTSYSDTAVSGTGWPNIGKVRTLNLLPGPHLVQAPSGSVVPFRVTDAGRVEFDPALDRMLSGRNTTTLAVRGLPVTVDTTDTDYTNTAISGTGWLTVGTVRTLNLLPGPHYVQAPTGGAVRFQVTDAGRVAVDESRWVSGSGTSTLTVHGVAVTIDATATTHTGIRVAGVPGWKDPHHVQTVRLLPGNHRIGTLDGRTYDFVVTDNGLIDYDPSLDTVLLGRNTTTLTIRRS
jgi:hypothetical protein